MAASGRSEAGNSHIGGQGGGVNAGVLSGVCLSQGQVGMERQEGEPARRRALPLLPRQRVGVDGAAGQLDLLHRPVVGACAWAGEEAEAG